MRSAALFAFALLAPLPATAACPAQPGADTRSARIAGNGWSVSSALTRKGSEAGRLACLSARFSHLPYASLGYDYRSGRSTYRAALTNLSLGAVDWQADATYTSTTNGPDRLAVSQTFQVGDLSLAHRRVLLPRSAALDELQMRTTVGPLALGAVARFSPNLDRAWEQRLSARIVLPGSLRIGASLKTGDGAPVAASFAATEHSSSVPGAFSLRFEVDAIGRNDAIYALAGLWTFAAGERAQIDLRAESELASGYNGAVMVEGHLAF